MSQLQSRQRLSVLTPCFNNEDIIEDCLRSVSWADQIVVCDTFSSDRTCEIARKYADVILQHEYRNSASQKNWAIPQVAHEWVLVVDTDERITAELQSEIEQVLADPGNLAGFRIPRANHIFGRWLRYGGQWPDYQIRLFQRDRGRYEDREVHAHVILDGSCGVLVSPFLHYPHRSLTNMRRVLLQRYTTWEAQEKSKRGVRFHWHQLLLRPFGSFADRYVRRRGYRDGWQGLFMASVWSCYVFITYLKLRNIEKTKSW